MSGGTVSSVNALPLRIKVAKLVIPWGRVRLANLFPKASKVDNCLRSGGRTRFVSELERRNIPARLDIPIGKIKFARFVLPDSLRLLRSPSPLGRLTVRS